MHQKATPEWQHVISLNLSIVSIVLMEDIASTESRGDRWLQHCTVTSSDVYCTVIGSDEYCTGISGDDHPLNATGPRRDGADGLEGGRSGGGSRSGGDD